MRRGQVVVVAVHLAGELEQRLAGVPGRPARPQLVAVDERPRDVRDDVDDERDREQADRRPDRRAARASPGRSQPSAAGDGGSRARRGSSAAGGAASGPKPHRPASVNAAYDPDRADGERDGDEQRVIDERADRVLGRVDPPERDRAEEQRARPAAAGADREPHLLVGPGDRVVDAATTATSVSPIMISEERQVADRPGPRGR